jgi:cyclopropane fatty-acyl-phospholipid synthase-like methyltransferase
MEAHDAVGGKLFSPSAARNAYPIRDVLIPRLPDGARVLEIGCGTGEHAEAMCMARPDLSWLPTDPDPAARASATARSVEITGLLAAQPVDVMAAGWEQSLAPVDAIVCCNVIHIAPWATAEGLAAGAERLLGEDGLVFLYGPYLTGDDTAPSNLAFDNSLKARNPEWGVRPLDAVTTLFERHNFTLSETIAMPANNLSLIFRSEPQ